jgi:hypothetical protein
VREGEASALCERLDLLEVALWSFGWLLFSCVSGET